MRLCNCCICDARLAPSQVNHFFSSSYGKLTRTLLLLFLCQGRALPLESEYVQEALHSWTRDQERYELLFKFLGS